MSDSNNALIAKPRIIIEAQPDGSLVLESYINGQRSRELLTRGFEMIAIKDELARQARAIENAAEEKRLRQEREEASRHRRVWTGVAENHGIGFANRTVGQIARTQKEPTYPMAIATPDLI